MNLETSATLCTNSFSAFSNESNMSHFPFPISRSRVESPSRLGGEVGFRKSGAIPISINQSLFESLLFKWMPFVVAVRREWIKRKWECSCIPSIQYWPERLRSPYCSLFHLCRSHKFTTAATSASFSGLLHCLPIKLNKPHLFDNCF